MHAPSLSPPRHHIARFAVGFVLRGEGAAEGRALHFLCPFGSWESCRRCSAAATPQPPRQQAFLLLLFAVLSFQRAANLSRSVLRLARLLSLSALLCSACRGLAPWLRFAQFIPPRLCAAACAAAFALLPFPRRSRCCCGSGGDGCLRRREGGRCVLRSEESEETRFCPNVRGGARLALSAAAAAQALLQGLPRFKPP